MDVDRPASGSDHLRSSREFRAVLAPAARPRWHYLYFALAAFSVLTVTASVYLGQRVSAIHRAALQDEHEWVERRGRLARLFGPLESVYAAGRRVSGPAGIAAARQDLREARETLGRVTASIRSDLERHSDSTHTQLQIAALDQIEAHVATGVARLEGLFATILRERRSPTDGEAEGLDTAMDSAFAAAAGLLGIADSLHNDLLGQREAQAGAWRIVENVVLALAVVMFIAAAWYGHHLWRHTEAIASERARLEEELLSAHEQLEERVMQRTADLAEAHEALRHAQKLEAVGRLAGGIAHDFNNLMTVVIGHCDNLLEELPADQPHRDDVAEIAKAAEQASLVTSQLLAFGRKQILRPTLVDVNAVVERCGDVLRPRLGDQVRLQLQLANGLGPIMADASQIELIVMNLATNAMEAMRSGGTLAIETAEAELDHVYGEYRSVVVPGRYVLIAVTDTGVGIDAAARSHLFEPFFTTKPLGDGTGLGLATVYGIVKQSGGYIWVYSERGVGATFKVYLPSAERSQSTVMESTASGRPVRAPTVLIVENEEAVRIITSRTLARNGYRVLEARGGLEAVALANGAEQPVDLLLVDLVLPDMRGREVVDRITSVYPEARVLYTSGFTDDVAVRQGLKDRGVPFLPKPFSPRSLLEKVRQVLHDVAGPSTAPRR